MGGATGLPHESSPLRPPGFVPSDSSAGSATGVEDTDPEIVRLPNPPRRERVFTLAVLFAGAIAGLSLLCALRPDVAYTLESNVPAEIGDLQLAASRVLAGSENKFVRGSALLGIADGVRYERPFRDETFRALPVIGRSEGGVGLWVEVRVRPGEENGRFAPPRTFAGRLIRFDSAGLRHRGLKEAIEAATRTRVPPGSFLLLDGEDPAGGRWALLLASMFFGLAVANGLVIARIVRRID